MVFNFEVYLSLSPFPIYFMQRNKTVLLGAAITVCGLLACS